MAEISYGVQIAQTHKMKEELSEFCIRIEQRMTALNELLQQCVSQGLPAETAQRYYQNYYAPDRQNISEFLQIVQKKHVEYLDGIIAILRRLVDEQ